MESSISIHITGHTEGLVFGAWLKDELNKVLTIHLPFMGYNLRVDTVSVARYYPNGRIHRSMTKPLKPRL